LLFVSAAWRAYHSDAEWDLRRYAGLGTLALVTLFVAGDLSESHYLFSVFPGAIIVVALTPRRVVQSCMVAAAVIALVPANRLFHGNFTDWEQWQLGLAQLVCFVAAWIDVTSASRAGLAPSRAGMILPWSPVRGRPA
jgi:hypothetical protein